MMLFLFRFWPALLPLIAYIIWMMAVRNKAKKQGEPIPHFKDGPWFWALVASLVLGVILFVTLGLSHASRKGNYVPPHMENGAIVPGHLEP